eukprot:gene15888-7220_t
MAEMRESLKQIKLSQRREEEQELLSSKQRQFEVESVLEKAKYEQKFQYERRLEELKSTSPPNEKESTKVKLRKLIISKSQGTHLDCVNGVKCRALLDTGAGSSCISDKLVNILGKRPVFKQNRQIDMMLSTVNRQIEIYNVEVQNLKGDIKLEIDVSKVDREVLLSVKNPRYQDVLKKYPHLQGVTMDDIDQKPELPVHVILGASEYAKFKTDAKTKIGKPGELVGEHTRLGWKLIFSGADADAGKMFFVKGTLADYERLCNLDVLGLENHQQREEDSVYSEFREQLKQQLQGYYETEILWKANCPPLQDNKARSLARGYNRRAHAFTRGTISCGSRGETTHSIYVDDILLSGETKINMEELKDKVVKIFDVAGFKLHKWHSNLPELEQDLIQQTDSEISEQSFAKHDSGGKLIYRDVCDAKLPWDEELSTELSDKWNKWTRRYQTNTSIDFSEVMNCHERQINLEHGKDRSNRNDAWVKSLEFLPHVTSEKIEEKLIGDLTL